MVSGKIGMRRTAIKAGNAPAVGHVRPNPLNLGPGVAEQSSVSTTSPPIETLRATPTRGCGTLESPWLGWESQLERRSSAEPQGVVVFAPGFWGASRPVRVRSDLALVADSKEEGQAWLLPATENGAPLETILLIDGAHRVSIQGLCFNGRRDRATRGVTIRCGTRIHLERAHFGDFGDEKGAPVLIAGESAERPVRGIVVQGCRILNSARGLWLGRDTFDLLVADNRFEEVAGASLLVDPQDTWTDYGLIFVKNRIRARETSRQSPHVRILPGAEGIRLAENSIEGPESAATNPGEAHPAIEVRGGGPMSRRRLEVMLNRIVGCAGPGISARQCGPGFLAAGNHAVDCGSSGTAAMDLQACTGVLVEDNEIEEIRGPGIRIADCARARVNGNEIVGTRAGTTPRRGTVGILLEGDGCRRLSVTDNRVRSVREEGVRVASGRWVRLKGNEVEDCGIGIRVQDGRQIVLIGNDCRDNSEGGIQVDAAVRRALVALNYAILNGPVDLEIRGERVRCRHNKVDRMGPVQNDGAGIPA